VLAALLESCRLANGDIVLPEALVPYVGIQVITRDS